MKLTHLYLLGIAFLLFLQAPSCSSPPEEIDIWTSAIITGQDARRCMCCGGFMITFSDNPTPYEAEFVSWQEDFQSIDDRFGITADSDFPLYVEIQYQLVENPCKGWENIIVEAVK